MKRKRRGALILAVLLLVLCVPVSATGGAFADVKDTDLARNVDVLQMMDVMNGVSYTQFDPDGTLTRAQFTKMAVMIQGKGNQVGNYKNYTIFPDVKSSHWASGYINLAVRGESKFIGGFSNGTFGPDQNITFGQAVTILMRLLGYADTDVGVTWPTGYINAAASAGLTSGMALEGNSTITRAQAAKLFVNLLNTTKKEGKVTFGESVAASVEKNVILLDANAKADDGSPAIETTNSPNPIKLAGTHAPELLQGRRGTLLLDSKGNAWGFAPNTIGGVKDIVVSSAKAGTITDKAGKEYTLTATTKAYYKGKETTYGDIFVNLRSGTQLALHFGLTGKVECVFVAGTATESAIVIDRDGNGKRLGVLTGGRTDYTIYRHGEKASAAALRANDVATYISGENKIQISTFRLTGRYDNAYPNTEAPTKINVLGYEFEVLPSAVSSISSFKLGDELTLLLTEDAKVAGAANPKLISSDGIGIAEVSDNEVSVELMEGITLKGKLESDMSQYNGMLVSVSSWRAGYLSLSQVRQNESVGALDVAKRTLGSAELAADVKIFERVKTGPVAEIALDDIRLATVSKEKILSARYNDDGKVSLLILDNVTGDRFIYGKIYLGKYFDNPKDPDNRNFTLGVKIEKPETPNTMNSPTVTIGPYLNFDLQSGEIGGVVIDGKENKIVSAIRLTMLSEVTNAAWESEDTVFFNNKTYVVSDDVICYNTATGEWMTLGQARAFGDKMTLYVDDFAVVRGVQVG
ncbi:MAG: S-layer y protein [Evtepia sp.]|nr:S-layer y protein [Evtepia sp.]